MRKFLHDLFNWHESDGRLNPIIAICKFCGKKGKILEYPFGEAGYFIQWDA